MGDFDDFKATYFDECAELLNELEEQFAEIEAGDRSSERLNAAFRAVHSIKGGAGAFGFAALVGFAHAYESLLDKVRDGGVALTPQVVALCIRANDIVADFVAAARSMTTIAAEYGAGEKAAFDALCEGGEIEGGEPLEEFDIEFTPVRVIIASAELGEVTAEMPVPEPEPQAADRFATPPLPPGTDVWEIGFRPYRELYARANDPLLLFRELAVLGELSVRAVLDTIPPLSDFEPFGVYCSWEMTLASATLSEAQIAEVFEFVDGNCELSVRRVEAPKALLTRPEPVLDEATAPSINFPDLMPEAPFAAEPEVETEAEAELPEAELPEAEAEADLPEATPSFAALAETLRVERPAGAAGRQARAAPTTVAEHVAPELVANADDAGDRRNGVQSIRVDLDKVDRVVNMVGELVITQSMLTQQMDENLRVRYQELVRGLEVLAQTTRGLQDSVMAIRAQPVKSVFSRMPRLARDLAMRTGKKIRLETVGENTEIDKTVIEQLSDPLTHMIRNSADHGIEAPEARLAAGKSETGTIRLSAEQAGGNILIIVEDDGAGINRDKVLQVARGRGVVAADQTLTDEQVDQLIFAPGFSTADAVSDISGRGVGMDVVLSNIKKIGGSVHVRSWTGRGTRMTLRLPLTLAVLDVMLVRVAQSPYVIPLSSIIETVQCARASFERAPSGDRVLQFRGEYVQVIDLCDRFELARPGNDEGRFVVLCEAEGSVKVALVVDDIIGQQQVVIKSLEENFESVEGIAGGTILGDGNVALIVDVQGLKSARPRRAAAA
jgi:two-component system chemotaxis sensor kinase CheA